jgi:hypothetical protein
MAFKILLALLVISTSSFSQQLRLRLEGGINSAGFPKSPGRGKWDQQLRPLMRPAFGVHLIGEAKIGVFADVNARYYSTGVREIVTRNDTDRINNTWFRAREVQKFSFTRLAYGIGIGYRLPVVKKKISVIAGYRKIYHYTGHYSYDFSVEDGLGNSTRITKAYDPFSEPNLDVPARRNGREIYFAATFDFTKRFGCLIQYSFPNDVLFDENMNGHTSWDHHGYVRNDASIAVLYSLR